MRKLLALLLAVVLVCPLGIAAAQEAPFEISIMLPSFFTETFQAQDNPVVKAIEAATNTKLTFNFIPNASYVELTGVTLADKDKMPMLMVIQGPQDAVTVNAARAGAFWDVTDYIKDYQYLNAGNAIAYDNIKVDGRLYGVYRSRPLARNGIIYRSDVAAKLGFTEPPKNLDELMALAKAYAGQGDNKYALNMCKYVDGTIKIITVMHGAPNTWGVNAEGNIYPAHEDPAFLEGLNWLRELYAAGGIDPDFMVIESGAWDDSIKNEESFMKFDVLDGGYRLQDWFEQNKGATETIFNLIPTVENAKGEKHIWPTTGFNGEIVITKSVKTEEDMKKCLAFLDYLNSAEGQNLINWGVKDVTWWTDEAGYRIATPADKDEYVKTVQNSLNQLGMGVNGDLTSPMKLTPLRELYNKILVDWPGYAVANPCFTYVSETSTMFGAQLNTLLEDACVQYIANLISEDELKALFQQWSDEGGAKLTEEFNAIYHAAQAQK
jgi:putative aldouronate transport system substrate-binding protein